MKRKYPPSELMQGNSIEVRKGTWRRLFLLKEKLGKNSIDDLMNLLVDNFKE